MGSHLSHVTALQVHEAFTKFGVIREDESGQPRIKLYRCALPDV
jgi:hypothetical protein